MNDKISEYVFRDDHLLERCKGRRVLRLGCVGFTDCDVAEKIRSAKQSLHFRISEVSDCEGVDLDGDAVRELKEHGLFTNVVEGDVERLANTPLSRSCYEVVVAGDIIEHLSNPGLMLDGVRELLSESGELLISTPNAFGLPAWLRFLFGRFREGKQHVICFNAITLRQLLERHGYRVKVMRTCYQGHSMQNAGALFPVLRAILRSWPRFGGTLLFSCRVSESN